jgi:hypothetical protein
MSDNLEEMIIDNDILYIDNYDDIDINIIYMDFDDNANTITNINETINASTFATINATINKSITKNIKDAKDAKDAKDTKDAKNKNADSIKSDKKNEEFIMPTRNNYSILLSTNYTIKQLKQIATHHKIKLSGVSIKTDIITKIYNHFKLYDNTLIIQRAWRKYLFKQYNLIRGPARFKRTICVNDTDFFTMDELSDIPYLQFYSFTDIDNMTYGFDIMSLYNLFNKGIKEATNPYNRNPFPKYVKKNMLKIKWLSTLFNDNINFSMEHNDDDANLSVLPLQPTQQTIESRIISLFHDIDILGNYTDYTWFMDLDRSSLIKFILELNDIWCYRANLSEAIQREICPTHRDLFRMMYLVDIRVVELSTVYEIALEIIEKLIRSGMNADSRCLGANFVLCALTLVSHPAAVALPWLFQSVL